VSASTAATAATDASTARNDPRLRGLVVDGTGSCGVRERGIGDPSGDAPRPRRPPGLDGFGNGV